MFFFSAIRPTAEVIAGQPAFVLIICVFKVLNFTAIKAPRQPSTFWTQHRRAVPCRPSWLDKQIIIKPRPILRNLAMLVNCAAVIALSLPVSVGCPGYINCLSSPTHKQLHPLIHYGGSVVQWPLPITYKAVFVHRIKACCHHHIVIIK